MLQERSSVITRKGQVTLPAEFRRRLGLRQGDKVAFQLDEDRVLILRRASAVQATAGVFKGYVDQPRSAEELRIAAEQAIAADVKERAR